MKISQRINSVELKNWFRLYDAYERNRVSHLVNIQKITLIKIKIWEKKDKILQLLLFIIYGEACLTNYLSGAYNRLRRHLHYYFFSY